MGSPPVRAEKDRAGNLRDSGRRVAVVVVVLSGHIGLLMLLLRPAISHRNAIPAAGTRGSVLNLRFIRQPRPTSLRFALTASRAASSIRLAQGRPSKYLPEPPPVQRDAHVGVPPSETNSIAATTATRQYAGSSRDGGFQQRLRNAQHTYAVRGIPGSDTSYVPGIHLIDPMNQGIGGVMRKVQRLFGIANRHCIDVDAWRQLTPRELSARHISSDDVDKMDEKYECNRPPGLSF
jgi:hypothetical protein